MGGHHSHTCYGRSACGSSGKRDASIDDLAVRSNTGMVSATSVCFAILAVKMCMSKRFNKSPESPKDIELKSIWFEGEGDFKIHTELPENFDKTKETDVIIHGYLVDSKLPEVQALARILRKKGNNVLLIDWGKGAGVNYRQSAANVQTVGAYVYRILVKNKISLDKVHIIGQGLGAQAAAEAGKLAKGNIDHITGLDPAGPLFDDSNFAINKENAKFVDIIHTDARPFGYGMRKPCGHLDVYVNGGRRQPGCTYNPKKPVSIHNLKRATFNKACGHLKALVYYIESTRDNCKLRACECTWKKFLDSKCSRDKCVYWGYGAKEGSTGSYYGVTATAFPYCRTDGSE